MSETTNLDNYLEQIAQDCDCDKYTRKLTRTSYRNFFNGIRDQLFQAMCNFDGNFRQIYKGCETFESYRYDLESLKDNEFEVILKLQLPFMNSIDVQVDPVRPAYLKLDVSTFFKQLRSGHYLSFPKLFSIYLDGVEDNKLVRWPFQFWLTEVIRKSLLCSNFEFKVEGKTFILKVLERGLTHIVYTMSGSETISIKLVPMLQLGKLGWMTNTDNWSFEDYTNGWFVVPKLINCGDSIKYGFLLVNPYIENFLLISRRYFNTVSCLFNGLIKRKNFCGLGSYLCTNILLCEQLEQDNVFWQKSTSQIFFHILQKFIDSFEKDKLFFFWNNRFNLLDIFTTEQKCQALTDLRTLLETFKSYDTNKQLTFEEVKQHFETLTIKEKQTEDP